MRRNLRLPSATDPFERPIWQRVMREELPDRTTLGDPKVVCSTCHDQHSQANEPFDPHAAGLTPVASLETEEQSVLTEFL